MLKVVDKQNKSPTRTERSEYRVTSDNKWRVAYIVCEPTLDLEISMFQTSLCNHDRQEPLQLWPGPVSGLCVDFVDRE